MKNVTICLGTEPEWSNDKLRFYRTYLAVRGGSIPALLHCEILDALADWMKFEKGDPNNRFECFR